MSDNITKLDTPYTFDRIDFSGASYPRVQKPLFGSKKQGKFVAVRKCGEEKTKLGLYLGDMAPPGIKLGSVGTEREGLLSVTEGMPNPAIFVFEDNQLVYGMESWWGMIRSPEHLRSITDDDINNVWYVQALRQLETDGLAPAAAAAGTVTGETDKEPPQ